jgi:hypothetical protein
MYNNVVPHWSAFLISCNHSITRLISFTKTVQIRDQLFLSMDPERGQSGEYRLVRRSDNSLNDGRIIKFSINCNIREGFPDLENVEENI